MALTPRERKAAQTARENEALRRLGGRRMKFIAYGGTMAALERICVRQGFTGQQRYGAALSWLIHENDDKVSTHEKGLCDEIDSETLRR